MPRLDSVFSSLRPVVDPAYMLTTWAVHVVYCHDLWSVVYGHGSLIFRCFDPPKISVAPTIRYASSLTQILEDVAKQAFEDVQAMVKNVEALRGDMHAHAHACPPTHLHAHLHARWANASHFVQWDCQLLQRDGHV